jgi:AraC-like DNA-binding protein
MDTNPTTELELISASFSDIDLFSDWATNLEWEVEATQLSAGVNEIQYDHFATPELVVGHFTIKQSVQMVSVIPDGMIVFLIDRANVPMVWNDRHYLPDLMAIAFSGLEGCAIHAAGWDSYEFTISEELIRRTGLLPPDYLATAMQHQHVFVPLVEPITSQFLEQLDGFFSRGRSSKHSPQMAANNVQFQDFIVHGLLGIIDAGLNAQGIYPPRSARRADLVAKANDFMHAHLATELSADDLAQALGVSYRVLNYAFKDSLGVSPYQYMLTQKLHAVRRQLKVTDADVNQVADSFGFNDLSRFSRQYYRLFLERPSETRRPGKR